MANTDNLLRGNPATQFVPGRANGRGAVENGEKSGKSRREKKSAKELMSYMLSLPIDTGKPKDKFKSLKDIKGKNLTVLNAGLAQLAAGVAKGDKKSIELALRISGEMVEQVQVNTSDEAIDALKAILEEKDESN